MPLAPARWRKVSDSAYPWEREALEFLAARLPNREPVRVWSNFEFVSNDGHVNEVDALVLTAKGLFLVEIKSRPARKLTGDAYAWAWTDGARAVHTDNPLVLTDRKAKRLASLLAPQERREGIRLPFIEPLIFCSAPGLDIALPPNLAQRVFGRDRTDASGAITRAGIIEALTNSLVGPTSAERGAVERPIDTVMAQAIGRMLDRGGVCKARSARPIGGYKLGARLADGPLYEDFVATHPALQVTRRVRLYPYPQGASQELRQLVRRAAEREFRALEAPSRTRSCSSRWSSSTASSGRRCCTTSTRTPCGSITSSAATTTSPSKRACASSARSPRRCATPTNTAASTAACARRRSSCARLTALSPTSRSRTGSWPLTAESRRPRCPAYWDRRSTSRNWSKTRRRSTSRPRRTRPPR